jgi:2-phosphosulfolactate phosphatase
MKIQRATLETCSNASDMVVVIDVLRAFTTSAYLFHAGVKEIILASRVNEAFELKNRIPDCIIAGEVNGIKVPGFDMGNSPSSIKPQDIAGKRVILRTTAGTQGVIGAKNASTILTASLVNISATVKYIRSHPPTSLTLIQPGLFEEEGWGDEDVACADVIEALLLNKKIEWDTILKRVCLSKSGSHYDGKNTDFPIKDLELTLKYDNFNFAMVVEKKNDLHCMHFENMKK